MYSATLDPIVFSFAEFVEMIVFTDSVFIELNAIEMLFILETICSNIEVSIGMEEMYSVPFRYPPFQPPPP